MEITEDNGIFVIHVNAIQKALILEALSDLAKKEAGHPYTQLSLQGMIAMIQEFNQKAFDELHS